MKLSRTSVGLAVRAAREAAGLTLQDLANLADITPSSLSRSENGLRDLAFSEVTAIATALNVDVETFRTLAETFQLADYADKRERVSELERDLVQLQRAAVEAAIEARAHRAVGKP